jgi:hypothetical protein
MKKRFVFVTFLIAMIVLTLMPISLVRATDTWLPPISGSDCNPTTFEYRDHTIAEGFAVSISAQIPLLEGLCTEIKFGCAVASLGDVWEEGGPIYGSKYVPYVKEMSMKVEGDHHYSDQEDAILDNTGTGDSSWQFFQAVLTGIDIAFNAWQIYDWLAEIYQEPPVAEWQKNAHWSKAIVRQKTEPGDPPWVPWVNPDEPRLQTATANLMPAHFEEGSSRILNITAQAEIYVQQYNWYSRHLSHHYIGTYSVSFEVALTRTLSISASSGGTTDPAPGTYMYDYYSFANVSASAHSGYTFDGWILDGSIIVYENPINVTMDSDHTLDAYFSVSGGGGSGGGEPCPTLFVWDGNDYVDYGVIDIHNPTGEDVVREVPVLAEDVSISNYKARFRLREGWEGLSYSESVVDQVKLYAVDDYGNRSLCPLIKAVHSEQGKVLSQLLLSDNVKVQMLLLETIDLRFVVPYQNVQSFTFIIEGCNMIKWD